MYIVSETLWAHDGSMKTRQSSDLCVCCSWQQQKRSKNQFKLASSSHYVNEMLNFKGPHNNIRNKCKSSHDNRVTFRAVCWTWTNIILFEVRARTRVCVYTLIKYIRVNGVMMMTVRKGECECKSHWNT